MKSGFYISLGVWIALLPFLGFPGGWRDILVNLSGIFLALTSLGPIVLKKLQTKPKQKKKKGEITHPPTPSLTTREGESEKPLL